MSDLEGYDKMRGKPERDLVERLHMMPHLVCHIAAEEIERLRKSEKKAYWHGFEHAITGPFGKDIQQGWKHYLAATGRDHIERLRDMQRPCPSEGTGKDCPDAPCHNCLYYQKSLLQEGSE